jgi:hypothetical protein
MKTRILSSGTAAILIASLACALGTAACSSGGGHGRDHGTVLARLPIPFRAAPGSRGTERIALIVRAGQRFAVKVATSDGPYWWTQSAPAPDARIVRAVGNIDDGSCPSGQAGCRVPYFRTLVARSRGTTTMTWRYHDPRCAIERKKMTQASRRCAAANTVIFSITVR